MSSPSDLLENGILMAAVEPIRPTPEQFLTLIRRQERGRLKVYLGSSAGVGKTYAMLREGQRLKKQGVDVAIGIVETHGRVETAEQIGDLEIIPPREIEYRGVVLREMDLDAIIARRPTICLVDELAHTNVPGSRHQKRYQDVEELLRSGIHVITTVNIQHIESLYDEVERATGVKVKERLPDSVVAEADQIVNVDVSVEDLVERMKAGKVYPAERIERALEHFFTEGNLTRLREITLSEMVHLIDRRSRLAEAQAAPASAAERVMVGISSRAPNAPALLRKTSRLADRISAPWYVVYIQTPAEDLTRIDAATQRVIGKNLELAQQLGGIPMTFRGRDVASTIAAFAKEYGIKMIVMGKSRQPWHRRILGPSILDRLLLAIEGIDVVIVDV
jgi:two-component system sensor histidine kinase KdpD